MTTKTSRAEVIFFAALEKSDPGDRAALLDRECGADERLRSEVQQLLDAHDKVDGFLEGAAADVVATRDAVISERAGAQIGNYKLLQQIGQGGFGVVFMAQQLQPVRRKVALKVIKPGMDSREVIARFEAERQALAMMEHPNIARVLDGGATESGRPYFVMELVKGKTITEYADANKLNVRERLELFQSVCFAVQHAHQKGIIHRDLKPANIMVTLHDGKPVAKIIDFGIAKALNRELTERTLFTAYGQMVGTPQYMSPEQAEMSGLDVDTRSDIYSLGVLLYELLTGTTPLTSEQLRMAAYAEIQRLIREKDPPKPSTRISTSGAELTILADHRSESPQHLYQLVRGDLDLIVMKALEKDRTRRYETAAGFAYDLERYLHDEPVTACPPSATYRMWKFCRRNRGLVTAALLLAAMLVIAIVGTTTGWIQARIVSAQLAEKAEELARQGEELQEQKDAALAGQQREHGLRQQAESDRELAETARSKAEKNLYIAQMQLAYHALSRPHAGTIEDTLERWMPDPLKPDPRGWEWYYLMSESRKDVVWTLRDHELPVHSVTWAHDNVRCASVGDDAAVRIWDLRTGEEIAQLAKTETETSPSPSPSLARWSPDGATIATAHADGTIQLWDGASYEVKGKLEKHEMSALGAATIVSIDFSSDGRVLVSYGFDQTVRMWDVGTLKQLHAIAVAKPLVADVDTAFQDFPFCAAMHPDGKRFAVSAGSTLAVWDVESESKLPDVGADLAIAGHRVAWSPSGEQIAVAVGGTVVPHCDIAVLDATTGSQLHVLRGHLNSVVAIAWDHTGSMLATSGLDHTVRIWDVKNERVLKILQGHRGNVWDISFSPDGRNVVSGAEDGTVRVWQVGDTPSQRTLVSVESAPIYRVAWSPDGKLLASTGSDNAIRIWDCLSGKCTAVLTGHTGAVIAVVWSPDGTRLASASADETARMWDLQTGNELCAMKDHGGMLLDVAWSPDGRQLATVAWDKMVRIWDVNTGTLVKTFEEQHYRLFSVDWSPDGKLLGFSNPTCMRIWEHATNRTVVCESLPAASAYALAFSPDGRDVVYSVNHDVVLQRIDGSEPRRTLTGHTADVFCAVWQPEGRRLATAGADGVIRIWDSESGQEILAMTSSSDIVYSVAWSPDGQMLASSGSNGEVQVWDASKGYQLLKDPTFVNWQTKRQVREAQRLSEEGSHEQADMLLTEVLKWKPEDLDILWTRSAVRARMGDYRAAAEGFARICELDSENWGALYASALLNLRIQDREGFTRCWNRILDAAEKPDGTRTGCVWLCMLDPLAMRDLPRAKVLIDRFYETAKSDPDQEWFAHLIDIRRKNPTEPLEPAGEETPPHQRAVDGFWESVRLLELDRQAEARVEYDRAHRLLDEARQKVVGPQWWSIVAGEILAREIQRRLQISPPDPSPLEGRP